MRGTTTSFQPTDTHRTAPRSPTSSGSPSRACGGGAADSLPGWSLAARLMVRRLVTLGEEAAMLIPSDSSMTVTARAPNADRLPSTIPPIQASRSHRARLIARPVRTPMSRGLRKGAVHRSSREPVCRVDQSRIAKAAGVITRSWSRRIGAMAVASPSSTMSTGIPRLAALT